MAEQTTEDYKPKNYHRLAKIMQADSNMAIFRRFDDISALRLISLQAEILKLRARFMFECKKNDKSSYSPQKDYSKNFGQLHLGRINSEKQALLMDEMFSKLDQYYKCMIQAAKVSKMRVPNGHQFKVLQNWLEDKQGGNMFLNGFKLFDVYEAQAWRDEDASLYHYVTPSPSGMEGDAFTSWVHNTFMKYYHRIMGHKGSKKRWIDEESALASYADSSIEKVSRMLTTAVSSVVPVLTIYILNILDTTEKRIGFTAGMTALFAALLALLTAATRVEIFSATATFAAVEVVYIGTVLGKS